MVITYKEAKKTFENIESVDTAHFGAIEGIDRWGAIQTLIVIGRTLPRRESIEQMAAALTGKAVFAAELVYRDRPIRLKSGEKHVIKAGVYEQPDAELVRRAITEAELIQAIGRARGVNRTADKPVEVFVILHDTALPMAVDAVEEFSDSAVRELLGRPIIPQFPGDAARLYPDLWSNSQSARDAYRKAQLRIEYNEDQGVSMTWRFQN